MSEDPQKTKTDAKTELVEGFDYTIENGFLVFTRAYLLKRGFCCNNGCRHCPYRKTPCE